MAEIIRERLTGQDCKEGFVLDGFPRTISQAELFDNLLDALGRRLTAVVFLDVPERVVIDRLSKRLACAKCSAVYQMSGHGFPGKSFCQRCGGKLSTRPDDRPDVVRRRLKVYAHETTPVIAKFRREDILIRVDGTGPLEKVFERIDGELRRRLDDSEP